MDSDKKVGVDTDLFQTHWSFGHVWNKSLEDREQRPVTPRDRIWASELGKAHLDVYLKMKGEEMTNPPNARSLRKFEAGNIWEWIVKLVLARAGILQEQQTWLGYQYPGLLEVSGKLDFKAGGFPDFEKGKQEIEKLELPEVFTRAFKNIMEHFDLSYPNGLSDMILEVKSLSSYMYDNLERTKTASKIHRLQTFHYLKATGLERANIVYICRDDCRMMEIPISIGEPLESEYRAEIEAITRYFKDDIQPEPEKPIVWDDDIRKFAKNFRVAYSGYLTKIYGFKDQKEFDDKYQPQVERWNRVIGRMKAGSKMTEKNLEVIEEMKAAGFSPATLVEQYMPAEAESLEASLN